MAAQTTPPQFALKRYRVLEPLGHGAMGRVYRVYDRLLQQTVALKQVILSDDRRTEGDARRGQDATALRLALAQEFRTLSTLRHPNIISVLDYGFEANQHPYFTMELLENPQRLDQAAQGAPLRRKLELLLQVLQALRYLHRRGVIHHDLKPGNVLVTEGRTKVVDFGLAMNWNLVRDDDQIAGTLAYMAPEVLQGAPSTTLADLYAFGIIAYEMIAERHPFDLDDTTRFIEDLILHEPDVSHLDVNPALQNVIARLLTKQVNQRYPDADSVIDAILDAANMPLRTEDRTTRESFLQAAQFIGREHELETLSKALQGAQQGRGSMWLVSGESGVGKSRLLDELRTRALVDGMIVMRGQSVSDAGMPYRQWRNPVRHLALSTTLTAKEAAVLRDFVPSLGDVLDEPLPANPADQAAMRDRLQQDRIASTIVNLFRRQSQPTLLLLEDLQWAKESLRPLAALMHEVEGLPLLIVGSYRDDERPSLPAELPPTNQLHLDRLPTEAVAALSASMLGDPGRNPDVLRLLQRETEGNTYFIVEVVRALVEDAGQLSHVGRRTLPMRVMSGGIQAVLRRRLERVPEASSDLLKLAAVAGRDVNMRLLRTIAPGRDVDAWLVNCADAAVLEIREGRWRFAHDKLRDVLLADLPEDERPRLHRRVAEGLEAIYHDDPTRVFALAEHWYEAGDLQKSTTYAYRAADQAMLVGDFPQAQRLLSRALALLPDSGSEEEQAALRQMLGRLFIRLSDYPQADRLLEEALAVAREMDARDTIVKALNDLAFIAALRYEYEVAEAYAAEALEIAQQERDGSGAAYALNNLGVIAEGREDYTAARHYYNQALAWFRQADDQPGMASALNNLGTMADTQGDYAGARRYYEEALRLCREIGLQYGEAALCNNLGLLHEREGNYAAAWDAYQMSLPIASTIGNRRGRAASLLNLVFVAGILDRIQDARRYLLEALIVLHKLEVEPLYAYALAAAAYVWMWQGEVTKAAEVAGVIMTLPYLDVDFKTLRLEPLQEALRTRLSDDERASAVARGTRRDAAGVMDEALHRLADTAT